MRVSPRGRALVDCVKPIDVGALGAVGGRAPGPTVLAKLLADPYRDEAAAVRVFEDRAVIDEPLMNDAGRGMPFPAEGI